MPVRRKDAKRRLGLTPACRKELEQGFAWPTPFDGYRNDPDDQEAGWREHGEQVLADWIAQHPGSRPWGWWAFAAPDARLRLGGTDDDWRDPPRYESQLAYLERTGSLLEAERAALAAFPPARLDAMRDPEVVHAVTGPLPGQPGYQATIENGDRLFARRLVAAGTTDIPDRFAPLTGAAPVWPIIYNLEASR